MSTKLRATIRGTRAIIIQSDRLVDPLSACSVALKKVLAVGKDTPLELKEQAKAEIEWFGCLYLLEDQETPAFVIPANNIIRALRDAAARDSKRGKDIYRGVDVVEEVIPFIGAPTNLTQAFASGKFMLRKSVVVNGKARVMRVRPRLPTGWALVFNLTVELTSWRQTITTRDPATSARAFSPTLPRGTHGKYRPVVVCQRTW